MNSAPILNIVFSRNAEIERVKYVYKELDWYREHGYNVHLPGGIKLEDCAIAPELDELLHKLDAEFSSEKYGSAKQIILKRWNHIMEQWPFEEVAETTLVFQKSYNVHLTRYGTGGSYNLPNQIELNIELGEKDDYEKILFHEMIHLCIEPLVRKYNIPHWYKERVVDLTFKKLIPNIAFEQDLPEEARIVDTYFAQHYGDFVALFSSTENRES